MLICVCTLTVYCGVGAYNNHKITGKTGLDALPHIDAIRQTAGDCWENSGAIRENVEPIFTRLYHEFLALMEFLGTLVQSTFNISPMDRGHAYGRLPDQSPLRGARGSGRDAGAEEGRPLHAGLTSYPTSRPTLAPRAPEMQVTFSSGMGNHGSSVNSASAPGYKAPTVTPGPPSLSNLGPPKAWSASTASVPAAQAPLPVPASPTPSANITTDTDLLVATDDDTTSTRSL